MPSDLPKHVIKLAAALLKHQCDLWLGEETVGIAAKMVVDIAGEDVQKKVDGWLSTKDGEAELLHAAQQADEYFRKNCKDDALRQAFTLSFGDLNSVQEALGELPAAMDSIQVQEAIQTALVRDIPSLTSAQATGAARLYTESLQRALLSVEAYALPIIGQTVLDNKNKLIELGYDQKEILAVLRQMEERLEQVPPTCVSVQTPPGSLPFGSYVPFPRNALFTGRETDLKSLADNLLNNQSTNTVISQAITGMGGLGKTQLAVEFAYRYGYRFKGVHWLDLRDPQAIEAAIALCGTKMGYTQLDQRELVASTMKTWIEDGPRLLILDNFEEMSQVNDVLARFQHPSFRLLFTSRRRNFPKSTDLQVRELGVFSEEESAAFLANTLEQPETAETKRKLADTLGCLPLALELAASYINITNIGIDGYLKELADLPNLEVEQAAWLREQDATSPTDHDPSLFGTFEISWREVTDETCQKVFMIAGYLAPNTLIPLEIFKETLELEDKDLSRVLYRLNALGLLPAAEKLPSIHPLLAAYARTLSSEELLDKLANKLAALATQANDQMDQTGSLAWFAPLRPHVFSVAESTEEAGGHDAGILWKELGHYWRRIGDYPGARDAFERALKIDEAALGPDHPAIARDLNKLGSTLRDLGNPKDAKKYFERTLKIDEAVYGPDHVNVAGDFGNLAMVLQDLGDLKGAKNYIERALKIDEAAYGPAHLNVARDLDNLGLVLLHLGDLKGAKDACERALKIGEAAYGLDHPKAAKVFNTLGLILEDLDDLEGAIAAFERALKINEAVYAPDHPDVIKVVSNLGSVLLDLGDLKGDEHVYERALKVLTKYLPEDHPYITITQGKLNAVLKKD